MSDVSTEDLVARLRNVGDRYEYLPDVVRELVVTAVMHRD